MTAQMAALAFLGGTGPHGRGLGLGLRLARAGHPILIGSRDAARAEQVAAALSERVADGKIEGLENAAVCEAAEVLLVTVPMTRSRGCCRRCARRPATESSSAV